MLRRRRRRRRDSRLLNRAGPCFAAHVAHARAVAVLVRTGGARPNHSNGARSFVPLSLRNPVKELLPRSVFGANYRACLLFVLSQEDTYTGVKLVPIPPTVESCYPAGPAVRP
jgi:hypothetical protein